MKRQSSKITLVILFTIVLVLTKSCVNVQIPTRESSQNNLTPITLIHEKEFQVVQPGQTITAPKFDDVNNWFLISDQALIKINRLQIEEQRSFDK